MSLHQLHQQIRDLLLVARREFPPDTFDQPVSSGGPLRGTLTEFEEFLEQNELELAWDAIATFAKKVGASSRFWKQLAEAAKLMRLPDRVGKALSMVDSLERGR